MYLQLPSVLNDVCFAIPSALTSFGVSGLNTQIVGILDVIHGSASLRDQLLVHPLQAFNFHPNDDKRAMPKLRWSAIDSLLPVSLLCLVTFVIQ